MKIGELFAGYGGLGMGVASVLDVEHAWVADVCKFDKDGNAGHYDPHRGPCAVLAHRFPDVPNLGDVTKVDWSTVEPVDVLTGGSPCQDLSHAGKRAGMTEGTRSNLWVTMREAIATIRPSLVVWENVRGAASAEATSDLEHCPGCMGDPRHRGPSLRALGRGGRRLGRPRLCGTSPGSTSCRRRSPARPVPLLPCCRARGPATRMGQVRTGRVGRTCGR